MKTNSLFYFLVLLLMFSASVKAQDQSLASYPAGDVFFFQFLANRDEQMRAEDYQNFYPTLKRLNGAGFRVIMNWRAQVTDLQEALKNKRPTIIIWSSHGQPKGITDKLDEDPLFPPNLFKDISLSVFQFVVATCHGTPALKNYDLSKTGNVKFKSWDHAISTVHLHEFFKTWNFMENYPAGRVHQGLTCAQKNSEFQLISRRSNKAVAVYKTHEQCMQAWTQAKQNLVCAPSADKSLKLFDIISDKFIDDFSVPGGMDHWCFEAPSRAYKDKMCYLAEDFSFYQYDLKTRSKISLPKFNDQASCYKQIWSM